VDFDRRETLCFYVDCVIAARVQYLTTEDDEQDRETALEQEISLLKDQVKEILAKSELELKVVKVQKACENLALTLNLQMQESQRLRMELKQKEVGLEGAAQEAEGTAEVKCKVWAEKESQVKAGKAVVAEQKKWQVKGKAPLV